MRMFHKVLIFVLFASGTVQAQFRTANLSGTVADEGGMPLEGVGIKVTFLTPSRDFVGPTLVRKVWSGLTKEDGDYEVPSLLLGNYQVEASLAGFDTNLRWVPLRSSTDEMILDITLKAEGIREGVQRQTSLPGAERREPIEEPGPVASNESQRVSPDPEMARPPAEQPPTEEPPVEEARAEQPAAEQSRAEEQPRVRPGLLGEQNWLLWPALVIVLLLLVGIRWFPRIRYWEWNAGASQEIEPPEVAVSTAIEEPVRVEQEQEPARVEEPAPVEESLEAARLEEPVQPEKEIPAPIEEPFKVEAFSSPFLRQMEDHFEEQGEAVAYPLLSEKNEYLAKGFQITYKPGTHQEVWIIRSGGNHIMMLKPKSESQADPL